MQIWASLFEYIQRWWSFFDSGLYLIQNLQEHLFRFMSVLTLKAPITTAADDIHKYFALLFRENKTGCFKWILC